MNDLKVLIPLLIKKYGDIINKTNLEYVSILLKEEFNFEVNNIDLEVYFETLAIEIEDAGYIYKDYY